MAEKKNTVTSIDEYIAGFPAPVRDTLTSLRQLIHELAPEAKEKISYGMPTFYLGGNLVHFAAFQNHIGFYPAPSGIEAFREELSAYKTSKGAIRFPLDAALPWELIGKIVAYRVRENLGDGTTKPTKKI